MNDRYFFTSTQVPDNLVSLSTPQAGTMFQWESSVTSVIGYAAVPGACNRGRLFEEDHYYAYGLKITGISSKKLPDPNEGNIDNKNLYNDKELFDDGDLNWYDYGFRNYDPQRGRFTQLDLLTDSYPELTNYQYASNDPIANVDMDGLEGFKSLKVLDQVKVVGTNAATTVAKTSNTAIRIWGGIKALGGGIEMAAGAVGGAATSWTGIGSIAGGAAVVHGADVVSAGLTQALTGEETDTFTSQSVSTGLQVAGVSKQNADVVGGYVDAGISMALTGRAAGDATYLKRPPPINIGFRASQIKKFTQAATKNSRASKVMLGSYEGASSASYNVRAAKEYTFFQLENWENLYKSAGHNMEEMWKINQNFIDEQWNAGKDFFFSHNPNLPLTPNFTKEINYLRSVKNIKGFQQVNENLWKAIK